MHVTLLLKKRVSPPPPPQGLSHSTQFNDIAHLKLVHPIDGATNPTIPFMVFSVTYIICDAKLDA